ncbi:DUF2267 domain-containing protein [Halomicronema sp. CCY15110]|uniref:DUF2267 domain-containing protein n=1 Tax=Halomicronema sp. CCY15110 TaxID=2767773 RepID=UPI00195068A2|nr:DUF2267 domain-containing protein [Halomicronema sp. CCY15110]
MADQTAEQQQKTFLETIIEQSSIQTDNEAQMAAKVVFRILRDMMPTEQIDQIAEELHTEAPKANMEIADLWNDPNVMVAFFSRISPLRQLSISSDTFLLRLNQEGALPREADPKTVTKAVFAALKKALPQDKYAAVGQNLPDEIGQLWQQA